MKHTTLILAFWVSAAAFGQGVGHRDTLRGFVAPTVAPVDLSFVSRQGASISTTTASPAAAPASSGSAALKSLGSLNSALAPAASTAPTTGKVPTSFSGSLSVLDGWLSFH